MSRKTSNKPPLMHVYLCFVAGCAAFSAILVTYMFWAANHSSPAPENEDVENIKEIPLVEPRSDRMPLVPGFNRRGVDVEHDENRDV